MSIINESKTYTVPIWEKYTLSVQEAAKYFRIGEKKLRKFIDEHEDAEFILSLRCDEKKARFLNKTEYNVEAQRNYIKSKKARCLSCVFCKNKICKKI